MVNTVPLILGEILHDNWAVDVEALIRQIKNKNTKIHFISRFF